MSDDVKTLTPVDIKRQWGQLLESLPPTPAKSLRQLLNSYWPAPHPEHWKTAQQWAMDDGVLTQSELAALALDLPEEGTRPSRIEFSLYEAHRYLTRKLGDDDAARSARALLRHCYATLNSDVVDADILYADVLALRRVLIKCFQTGPALVAEPEGDARTLAQALADETLAASEPDRRRVQALLMGERGLGERQKRSPENPRQPRSYQRSQQAQRDRLDQHNQRRPQRLSAAQVDGDPSVLNVSETAHRQAKRAVHAVDEPPADIMSRLGKKAAAPVRFQVAARARQSISAQSLPSMLEAALVSDGQIDWAMRQLDTPHERCAVALLLQGWPIRRVEAIEVVDGATSPPPTPVLDRQTGVLHYRIEASGAATANLDMTLSLSPTLLAVMQDGEGAIFDGIGKILDRRWQSRGRSQPGLAVTCQRLTRTGRRVLWGLSEGGWEVAALSGRADLAESVGLTYRQIPPERLQHVYNHWCRHWRLAVPEHTPQAEPVGSTRALALPQLAEIQRRLHNRAVLAARHADQPNALRDSINTVTAYLVTALALVSGVRSLGPETELAQVGERLWVHEKNSRHRRESRTVTIPPELADALKTWCQRVLRITAPASGVAPDQGDGGMVPPWLSLTKTDQLRARPFRLGHWADLVTQTTDCTVSANAVRHTLATASQQIISYPLIHWLMGHHREQEAPVHPVANAPLSFTALRDHQRTMLKTIRFDPAITQIHGAPEYGYE